MKKISVISFLLVLAKSLPSFQAVDVNTASPDQIALLPGIGKTLAQNIVGYRGHHGPFSGLATLKAVQGMTDNKIAQINGKVTFTRLAHAKKGEVSVKVAQRLVSVKPIINIHDLERTVLQVHGLSDKFDHSLSNRVRKAAFLPKLSLVMDAGQDSTVTDKGLEKARDSRHVRGANDFGVSIRATFDLERLIFNKDELEVAKLSLKRLEKREEIIERLRKFYFQYVRLMDTLRKPEDDAHVMHNLSGQLKELEAILDSMSAGEFTRYQRLEALSTQVTP